MIKEVSLHMALFCISVCISVSLQSTDNQFMWHLVGILYYFLSQLCFLKKISFLHYPLSFGYSEHIYVLACSVCVCGFDCNEY